VDRVLCHLCHACQEEEPALRKTYAEQLDAGLIMLAMTPASQPRTYAVNHPDGTLAGGKFA
jgi:hypothetical protein